MDIYLLVCDPEKKAKGFGKQFSIRAYTNSAKAREDYERRLAYNPLGFKYYLKKVSVYD